MRTFEWKTTIFKKWEISNILHITSVTVLANSTMTQLNKTHKEVLWNHKKPKTKKNFN